MNTQVFYNVNQIVSCAIEGVLRAEQFKWQPSVTLYKWSWRGFRYLVQDRYSDRFVYHGFRHVCPDCGFSKDDVEALSGGCYFISGINVYKKPRVTVSYSNGMEAEYFFNTEDEALAYANDNIISKLDLWLKSN